MRKIAKRFITLSKGILFTPCNLFKDFVLQSNNRQEEYWDQMGANTTLKPIQVDGYVDKYKQLESVLNWYLQFLLKTVKTHAPSGARVLEFGCGTGRYLKLLEDNTNYDIYGVDYSKTTLENYTRHHVTRSKTLCLDLTQPGSVPSDLLKSFDVIYSLNVLQTITPRKLLQVMKNIDLLLKPSATLILNFAPPGSVPEIFSSFKFVRYPPWYIIRLMKARKFRIVHTGESVTGQTFSWSHPGPVDQNWGYWIVGKRSE